MSGIFVLGRGALQILVLSTGDAYAAGALKRFAESACDVLVSHNWRLGALLRERARLHVVPVYKRETHLPYLRTVGADALLVVEAGAPRVVVFSAGENTPRLFDRARLEESVKEAFSTVKSKDLAECQTSDGGILDSALASTVDEMRLERVFELGVGIGCARERTNADEASQLNAAIAGLVESLLNVLKKDTVKEFSVQQSVSPIDHFTPPETVMVTSPGFERLDASVACKTRVLNVDGMVLRAIGAGKGPHTLVLAAEMKTEAFVYALGHHLCFGIHEALNTSAARLAYAMEAGDGGVRGDAPLVARLLAASTLVLMPHIPHTQLNCHDYGTISPFMGVIGAVIAAMPEIDFVVIVGTGGIKVRYIDAGNAGHDPEMERLVALRAKNAPSNAGPSQAAKQASKALPGAQQPQRQQEDQKAENEKNGQVYATQNAQRMRRGERRGEKRVSNTRRVVATPAQPAPVSTVYKSLAELYAQKHEIMRQKMDMCASSRPATPVVGELYWATPRDVASDVVPSWPHAPNALLVQTACCYEGHNKRHIFDENIGPLLAVLEQRLQGISGFIINMSGERLPGASITILPASTPVTNNTVIGNESIRLRTTISGFYYVPLRPQKYQIIVQADGYDIMTSAFTIYDSEALARDFALRRPFVMNPQRAIEAAGFALAMIFLALYCIFESLRRRDVFTSRGGFERLPLRDFEDDNEDEDDDFERVECASPSDGADSRVALHNAFASAEDGEDDENKIFDLRFTAKGKN